MLREGVLTGRTIVLAGASSVLEERLATLGAAVEPVNVVSPLLSEGQTAFGGAVAPRMLVADARPAFAASGGGYEGVRAGVDGAFAAVREIAVAHWIPRGGRDDDPAALAADPPGGAPTRSRPGGQVVLVAPAPTAGRHAGAARAGLENLARTLSTEWARHQVTTVAVLPGDVTSEAALADLIAWLASPAGAYLSGTALTLDREL